MKQIPLVRQFIRTGILAVASGLAVGWLLPPATLAADTGDASESATPSGERKIKYYQSTMNPSEVKPGPGKDSMGMDMVPVYEGGDSSGSAIQIDAVTIQRMNLKTAPVERGPVRREIRAVGIVAYNEEGLRDITTKYEGWIEKLVVNATWTAVNAGDALFEIYSPDLYNAQLNYLVARESESGPTGPLTRAALARLELFDVPKEFIDEVVRAGEPKRTYLYRAPTAGVVIEKMAVEGQMVAPGERIYRLADLSSVWALTQIYESDLPFVKEGQPVTVRSTYGSDRTFSGKIDLLLPRVEEQTRTVTARLVLENPDGLLRPEMFVDVRFATQVADSAVLVPDIAVLRSGDRNSVFVALEGGSFEPRNVTLGVRSEGNFYEVKDGLSAGECVVTSGQFMFDSESQLREAIQKMLRGEGNAPATDGHEDHSATADTPAAPAAGHSGRPMNDSPGAAGASATEGRARACGTRLDAHADPAHANPFFDR
jgi:multidrug efflux pump subunit AcrA (membrane-fusion protein)